MRFDDLVDRLREKRAGVGGQDMFMRPRHCDGCEAEIDLEYIAMAVIHELGLHVGRDGHVHDPRPAPPSYPRQTNVRSKYRRGRR